MKRKSVFSSRIRRTELCIKIVSPTMMRRLNLRYRGRDKVTDVLAFPIGGNHGILHLGDIFINRTNAKKKFLFLAIHGFLHLLGYDHERSAREEREMFALQDEILNYLRH